MKSVVFFEIGSSEKGATHNRGISVPKWKRKKALKWNNPAMEDIDYSYLAETSLETALFREMYGTELGGRRIA